MKLIIIGHAKHGKDTVSEILVKRLNMTFESSSHFLARLFIYPVFATENRFKAEFIFKRILYMVITYRYLFPLHIFQVLLLHYDTFAECYADRVNWRSLWFNAICWFNRKDLTRLGRMIFKEHDIYCGLRNVKELQALRKTDIPFYVIWVDACKRMPLEPASSFSITRGYADYVLDNNGTEEDLIRNIEHLVDHISTAEYYQCSKK